MDKRKILLGVIIVLLIYPAITAFQVGAVMDSFTDVARIEAAIRSYQLSVWLTWVVIILIAIFQKWTTGQNVFFYIIYIFLIGGFGVLGYFVQTLANRYDIATRFQDNYTFGVLTSLQNIVVATLLTAFLQAAVWWFTRRWHRR